MQTSDKKKTIVVNKAARLEQIAEEKKFAQSIVTTLAERRKVIEAPHSPRGQSTIGESEGKQYLKKYHYKPEEGWRDPSGIFRRGNAQHGDVQFEILPCGIIYPNGLVELGIEECFEVVAVENPVFSIYGPEMSWSPIDVLLWLPDSRRFIIVDIKSKDWKFNPPKEPDPKHIAQVNNYAHQFPSSIKRYRIDENDKLVESTYRFREKPDQIVLYISSGDWNAWIPFYHKYDKELALTCIENKVRVLSDKPRKWSQAATCLWEMKYKNFCKYCPNPEECLRRFGEEYDEDFEDQDEVRKHVANLEGYTNPFLHLYKDMFGGK